MNIEEQFLNFKNNLKNLYNHCSSIYENADKENIIKILIPALIISVGVYACTQSRSEAKKNVKELFVIANTIRDNYIGKADYWGISTASVLKNNILPKKYIIDNKIILSGNREVLIGSGVNADIVMPQSQTFDIVIKDLNKTQCMAYSEVVLEDEELVSLNQISIVNDLGSYSFEWGGNNPLPVQKYSSKNLCSDNKNTLIWSVK